MKMEEVREKIEDARRALDHNSDPEWELRPEYLREAILALADALERVCDEKEV